MRAIIAAAGTAGHINPGIAIANKIKKEQNNSKIIFLGTTRGLENDLVNRAGYELKAVEAYGLSKKINLDSIKKNIKTLQGFKQARKIIQDFKPDIVIGTGGYICGSAITQAHRLKIPTLLHESNAFPGKAVKMLAGITDTVLVSFKDTIPRIKNAKNVVYTGTPVKNKKIEYTQAQRQDILKQEKLNLDMPIVLVFGGSQGARKINEAMIGIINNKLNMSYQVIWATGPKQYDIVKEELYKIGKDIANIDNMKILPYIYNMEEIMNISDLIVARSGAMTITEIANLGKASILIPLPNVSHDHQLYNARVLEKVNATKIILDKELNYENLNNTIINILQGNKIIEMGINAEKVATKDVEDLIYKEIIKLVNKKEMI